MTMLPNKEALIAALREVDGLTGHFVPNDRAVRYDLYARACINACLADVAEVQPSLSASERHELECLRLRVQQIAYPCSPHCDGYLRELALRNQQGLAREGGLSAEPPQITPEIQHKDEGL